MKLVAGLLVVLFLNPATGYLLPTSRAKGENPTSTDVYYLPIKWALIVLGGFDYYKDPPGYNSIQKTEHWIQSQGVPYDVIEDDCIVAPADAFLSDRYPLQYSNGTIKYGVFVMIMNHYEDTSANNTQYVCWAVGNGTNAVVFGMAARYIPTLLNLSKEDVSIVYDPKIRQVNCTIHKTFSDGIVEYQQDTNQTINAAYTFHINISNVDGKTIWYTMHSDTGRNWIGMVNATYGYGSVFWNTLEPWNAQFLWYSTFSDYWENKNMKFVAHAIDFMFRQVKRIDLGLQGYKRWGGALTYRLDQDTDAGISTQEEEALKKGWYVDVVIAPLGYRTYGGDLTEGMPLGYSGTPSTKVKTGNPMLTVSTDPSIQHTFRNFIIYNSTAGGVYDTMKVDWNENKDFADDQDFKMWENMTSDVTGLIGTYYWGYIDSWEDPTKCGLGWWCPLRERLNDFTWWKEQGQQGYISYGFHSYQHMTLGSDVEVSNGYVYWNGTNFTMNQTYIEEKFSQARNELTFCLGGTGNGFEADRVLVSHAGNTYSKETAAALYNLSWVYVTSGDNAKNEPGWFLYEDQKPAMTCGAGAANIAEPITMNALKDAVRTLFPIFGIYEHNEGIYDLNFSVYPPDTAYTDMFCFAHLDESFEFWSNAQYMWRNTVSAYYKNNKVVLEYKANSTLKDYVWKFPVTYNGKYFNGFSDNRTIGTTKHIDGKYVYVELKQGGNERIEVNYGAHPYILQTSHCIDSIAQTFSVKSLALQLENVSGKMTVDVDCIGFGQPEWVRVDGSSNEFSYEYATRICSFNVTLNGTRTVEIFWSIAPPDSPTLTLPCQEGRFNPGEPVTFSWAFNDPDAGDFQQAYRFQLSNDPSFGSIVIETGKTASTTTRTTQTLPEAVGLCYWRVTTWDSRDFEGEWSSAQTVIVDRLSIIQKGSERNRTDIGAPDFVYFIVVREYDTKIFDGTKGEVYVNDLATTWDEANKYWKLDITYDAVGEETYGVTGLSDYEHNITITNDLVGPQKVIWDRVICTITPDASDVPIGTQVNFTVSATYAYDNRRVSDFSANISRNGTHFSTNNFTDTSNSACKLQYTIENVTEDSYGLTSFTSETTTVTWTLRSSIKLLIDWIASNILIIAASIQLAIVLSIVGIRKQRKHRKPRSALK